MVAPAVSPGCSYLLSPFSCVYLHLCSVTDCQLPMAFGCFHSKYQDNGCLQGASLAQGLKAQELLPRRRLSFGASTAVSGACNVLPHCHAHAEGLQFVQTLVLAALTVLVE